MKSPFPLGVDRSQKAICVDRRAEVRCQMAKILSELIKTYDEKILKLEKRVEELER